VSHLTHPGGLAALIVLIVPSSVTGRVVVTRSGRVRSMGDTPEPARPARRNPP